MSAIKSAQEKVAGYIPVSGLVAGIDFSILLGIAVKLLMESLGNCINKSSEAANTRVQDDFWYQYFVEKAAKDAVNELYPKHERSRDARKLLAGSICKLSVEDRMAVVAELQEVHDDAGFLF